MQSTAADVDAYLAEAPAAGRPALATLRDRCRAALSGYEEGMAYGMPSYARDGVVEVAWASQKRHVSLYVMKAEVVDAHRQELAATGASIGKGCIRYAKPDRIDLTLVERLLRATAASTAAVC